MASLPEVRRLLAFSRQRQDQCQRRLERQRSALLPLEQEMSEIDRQTASLQALLASQAPDAQVLSHAELLALLRRQAVIRRQISHAALEQAQLRGQCEEVAVQIRQLQLQRQAFELKHNKYQRLEQRLLLARRSRQWRLEESETEEWVGLRWGR